MIPTPPSKHRTHHRAGGRPGRWGRRVGAAVTVATLAASVTAALLTAGPALSSRTDRTATRVSAIPSTDGPAGGQDAEFRPSGDSDQAAPTGAASVSDRSGGVAGVAVRDAIAAAPMLAVTPSDAQPGGTPARTVLPELVLPAPSAAGAKGVPSGFPRTPEGAVAQLAALTGLVVSTMSEPYAVAVQRAWSASGADAGPERRLTGNVRSFLTAAGMTGRLDPGATVTAVPVAGQVKGVHGDRWVLACVLLVVRAVITAPAEISYGYCERMTWHTDPDTDADVGGRWLIAPGTPPATAPATWPGTETANRAGWRPFPDIDTDDTDLDIISGGGDPAGDGSAEGSATRDVPPDGGAALQVGR